MKFNDQNKNEKIHVYNYNFICPTEYWEQFKFDIQK